MHSDTQRFSSNTGCGRKIPECGERGVEAVEGRGSVCAKCSPRPPSSACAQLRPEGDIIYTSRTDSYRGCFTQLLPCPLSPGVRPSEPAVVTWVNMWRGSSTQVTSKLPFQRTYRVSLPECSTGAAFGRRLCLIALVWHEREPAVESFHHTQHSCVFWGARWRTHCGHVGIYWCLISHWGTWRTLSKNREQDVHMHLPWQSTEHSCVFQEDGIF